MIEDVKTVAWKERRVLFNDRSSRIRLLLVLLSPVLFSTYVALDTGIQWIESNLSLFVAVLIPLVVFSTTIPDSFAGERERKTLETLLASRLPVRAIFFGKMVVPSCISVIVTFGTLILSLVAVNIKHANGHFLLFPASVLFTDIGFSFLVTILVAFVGVFISIKSAGVQEATQILMMIFLILPLIIGVIAFVFKDIFIKVFKMFSSTQIIFGFLVVLFLIDMVIAKIVVKQLRKDEPRL